MQTPEEARRREQSQRGNEMFDRQKRGELRADRGGKAVIWYVMTLLFSSVIVGGIAALFDFVDSPIPWVIVGSLSAWAATKGWSLERDEQEKRGLL